MRQLPLLLKGSRIFRSGSPERRFLDLLIRSCYSVFLPCGYCQPIGFSSCNCVARHSVKQSNCDMSRGQKLLRCFTRCRPMRRLQEMNVPDDEMNLCQMLSEEIEDYLDGNRD